MKTYSVVLCGAGGRGNAYSKVIEQNPDKFKIVAVAEPVKGRREVMQKRHNIPDEMCFNSWEDVVKGPKIA